MCAPTSIRCEHVEARLKSFNKSMFQLNSRNENYKEIIRALNSINAMDTGKPDKRNQISYII